MLHEHLWPVTARVNAAGHLEVAECDVTTLAATHGTPLYLLDEATFRQACRAYIAALARHHAAPARPHYAAKALLNTAIARLADQEGMGLDVSSGGELFVALRAGFPAARIHLHGNATPPAELEQAVAAGVGQIVVDNLDELEALVPIVAGRDQPQPIALRLAPDIAADTHAHIQTGHATSKFGLPLDALNAAAERILAAPNLHLEGLHAHLGSQIFEAAPFARAVGVLLDCAVRLRERHGLRVEEINSGGGLGAPYTPEQPLPDVESYVALVAGTLAQGCAARGLPLPRLVLEPGRSIIARAGVALYTIVATKALPAAGEGAAIRYLHIDGGMGDNIRPALYGARYTAVLAGRVTAPGAEIVHVAGRYCESGDVLLRDVALPTAAIGELLAVAGAGAYTLSMASTYNLVPRPALLLVHEQQARLVQRRETFDDLVLRDRL